MLKYDFSGFIVTCTLSPNTIANHLIEIESDTVFVDLDCRASLASIAELTTDAVLEQCPHASIIWTLDMQAGDEKTFVGVTVPSSDDAEEVADEKAGLLANALREELQDVLLEEDWEVWNE